MPRAFGTSVHLIAGYPGRERARALALCVERLGASQGIALILEGVPTGFSEVPEGFEGVTQVLAVGCPCCTGSLVLRVTLARILRIDHPMHLVIALIDPSHLGSLKHLLSEAQWQPWLRAVEEA